MFTSLQLLHRLAAHSTVPDIAALSLAQRQKLLDAANAGYGGFFEALPAARRRAPFSALCRAPLTLTLEIVQHARGFSYVTGGGDPFPTGGYTDEASLVGHAVQVAGDARLNRLLRPGELLSPFLGSGGSSVSATFYGDSIAFTQDELRVLDKPLWTDATGGERPLVPLGDPHRRWPTHPFLARNCIEVGTPEYWWTEPMLNYERTASPQWLLRVWPLPAAAGCLSCTIESLPPALTMEDFTTARALSVPDREVPHLISLGLEALIRTGLLPEDTPAAQIRQDAADARQTLAARPQTHDTAPRRVGTRRGW